jgi:hypothetical protein
MSVNRPLVDQRDDGGRRPAAARGPTDPARVLSAVREDIRQTLRMAWMDPALESASAHSMLFTAAWSAIRPNVGKSFLSLARAIRSEAVESLRVTLDPPDLTKRLHSALSEEEIHRIEESARAVHLAAAKVQIVVHALHRAIRQERIAGTGREEPPIRRGVPEWQRWMSSSPATDLAGHLSDDAATVLGLPAVSASLRLFARWPLALSSLWEELRDSAGTEHWKRASGRLRRLTLGGMSTLPHPVELQWAALKARGATESDRLRLLEVLATHDASMAVQTLTAAFAWCAFGSPEVGLEG